MKRHTTAQVTAALRASGGIVSKAAKALGVHRHTLECRIETDPEIRDAHFQVTEEILDIAEGTVIKGVNEGDSLYTTYFLNKRGASRGYGLTKQTEINRAELPFTIIERVTVAPTLEATPLDRTLMLARSNVSKTPIEEAPAPSPPPMKVALKGR